MSQYQPSAAGAYIFSACRPAQAVSSYDGGIGTTNLGNVYETTHISPRCRSGNASGTARPGRRQTILRLLGHLHDATSAVWEWPEQGYIRLAVQQRDRPAFYPRTGGRNQEPELPCGSSLEPLPLR